MIRQPNNYTCGPIVLFNLQKWTKSMSVSYRELFTLTKCNPKTGTFTSDFEIALDVLLQNSQLKLIQKQIQPPNITLKNPKQAIILEYFTHLNYLHFILIIFLGDNLIMINEGAENKKIPIVQNANKLRIIKYEKNGIKYPIMWKFEF